MVTKYVNKYRVLNILNSITFSQSQMSSLKIRQENKKKKRINMTYLIRQKYRGCILIDNNMS